MTFVVTSNCNDCKFTDCVAVCPVDCFYEANNHLVIHPDECIDCGACEYECPVGAIYSDCEVPESEMAWIEINQEMSESSDNNVTETGEPLPTAEAKKQAIGY